MSAPALAYVGIGSNLNDPELQVSSAMAQLDAIDECAVIARSSLYVTAPVGFSNQPDFVNAACALKTKLSAIDLLDFMLDVESRIGRVRTHLPNRPRIIDLDLLLYGDQVMCTDKLTLPHPRMHKRHFVLAPLAEIDPDIAVPGLGAVADLLVKSADQKVVRIEHEPRARPRE